MAIRLLSSETIDGALTVGGGITTGATSGGNSGSLTIAGGITQTFQGSGGTTTFYSPRNTSTASATTDAIQFKITQKDTSGNDIDYNQGLIADGNAFFGKWQSGSITGIGLNVSTGNATFSGNVSLTSGALSITGDGSNAATLTESSAGILTIATVDDLILDCGGDLSLDAAGNDIRLKVNGVEYAKFKDDSDDLAIFSSIQDKDILFKGNDGGSSITALTLDMSEGGNATFAGNITISKSTPFITLSNTTEDECGIVMLDSADAGQSAKITYDAGSSNALKFYNNAATERMRIDSSGNVGIGTASPSEKLDVRGGNIMVGGFGGGTDYGLILTPDDGSGYWNIANVTGGALTFNNSNTIGSSEAMRITGGKIGIGTTSPDRTLDVEGTGMAIFGTGDYTELMLRGQVEGTGTVRNVGAWHWSVRGDVGGDNDDLKLLRFNTGSYSGTSMQVRSDNGGVAIGVNNSGYSSQILSVKSGTSDNVFYGESSDANCFASFRDNSSTANIEYGAIGNNHVFRKDTTEYMRIDSSGKVGIGTIAPASLLEIFGGGNTLRMDSAGNTAKTFLMRNVNTATAEIKTDGNLDINIEDGSRTMRFLNGNTERMRINSSGNVGIGRTSDTAKRLDVLGPGLRMQDTSAYSSITIGASGWNQDYPYQRLDTFNSDGTGYFWAMGHRKTDGTKTVRMLISDTSSRYVKVIDQLQVSAFASNELGGSGYYPTFTTNVVIRNQGDSYFNGGNVGIGTTTPSARLQSFGAIISQTAANDPEVTLTNTGGWGVQSGGTIRVMQGFSRSGVSGDQIIFTYAATSWKSWSLDYTFTSTQGLTQGTIGGYWNNSGGQGNVENIDNHQTSVAVTHGGTGNQNNIITFTFNAPGTHINCSFVYTQSGGDGAPRGDRVTIETISNIP